MVPARFDGTLLGLDEPMLAYRQAGSAMERGGGQAITACVRYIDSRQAFNTVIWSDPSY